MPTGWGPLYGGITACLESFIWAAEWWCARFFVSFYFNYLLFSISLYAWIPHIRHNEDLRRNPHSACHVMWPWWQLYSPSQSIHVSLIRNDKGIDFVCVCCLFSIRMNLGWYKNLKFIYILCWFLSLGSCLQNQSCQTHCISLKLLTWIC